VLPELALLFKTQKAAPFLRNNAPHEKSSRLAPIFPEWGGFHLSKPRDRLGDRSLLQRVKKRLTVM
jgi:hypothetical protein